MDEHGRESLHERVLAALKKLAEIASDPNAKTVHRNKARTHLRRRLKQIRELTRNPAMAADFMKEIEDLTGDGPA